MLRYLLAALLKKIVQKLRLAVYRREALDDTNLCVIVGPSYWTIVESLKISFMGPPAQCSRKCHSVATGLEAFKPPPWNQLHSLARAGSSGP
jgi:hypothetical protein